MAETDKKQHRQIIQPHTSAKPVFCPIEMREPIEAIEATEAIECPRTGQTTYTMKLLLLTQ